MIQKFCQFTIVVMIPIARTLVSYMIINTAHNSNQRFPSPVNCIPSTESWAADNNIVL